MNLKKILLSSVAAVALTSVSAFAADNSVATTVALDQTGDYLVFPTYAAESTLGYKTNIKVVNTNTTHAVIGKVVIREYKNSTETLDFPIYLTPGDVFEASLEKVDGLVTLVSTDDSMFKGGQPASATNPVSQALNVISPVVQTDVEYGYVEVFGVARVAGSLVDGDWNGEGTPLSKTKLYTKFNTDLNGATTPDSTDWDGVGVNDLYGQLILSAESATYGNLAMTLPATALQNVTGSDAVTGTIVRTDSTIDINIYQDRAADLVIDSIEDALQKSNVYVTYGENGTAAANTKLVLTQPMKKYRRISTALDLYDVGYRHATEIVDESTLPNTWYFTYNATGRDQLENSTIPDPDEFSGGTSSGASKCYNESCWITVNPTFTGTFAKGYADFTLNSASMPVIPVVMAEKRVGTSNITNIIYPAYK